MDFTRRYKKNIVENKNLIFISILLSVTIRLILFSSVDDFTPYYNDGGVLWSPLFTDYLYPNAWLSFILGTVFALGIAYYVAFLNLKYSLIRVRTYLVYIVTLLLFSCHPAFIHISAQYFSTLLLLIGINILYSSYQLKDTSLVTYSIGFTIAVASLFAFDILFYFILFWIGFVYMRSLNFRALVTFILGILTVYWLLFSYYLWQKDVPAFINIFSDFLPEFGYFNRLGTSFIEIYTFVLNFVVLLIAIVDNQVNAYQDKISIRAKISFLNITAIISMLSYFLVSFDPLIDFFIFTCSSAILLAHFFSLAESKWKVYLFICYIYMLIIGALGFAYLE